MDIKNMNHIVKIIDRKNISISGVKKLNHFNDKEFSIDSVMGMILIKGSELELIKLDTIDGNVSIKGVIDYIGYNDLNKKQESFVTKLFK